MTQNEHVYVICCRLEAAGDVISGENVKTIECCTVLNFEAAVISSFKENQNQPFATSYFRLAVSVRKTA